MATVMRAYIPARGMVKSVCELVANNEFYNYILSTMRKWQGNEYKRRQAVASVTGMNDSDTKTDSSMKIADQTSETVIIKLFRLFTAKDFGRIEMKVIIDYPRV